jgi:hypothetical protein
LVKRILQESRGKLTFKGLPSEALTTRSSQRERRGNSKRKDDFLVPLSPFGREGLGE